MNLSTKYLGLELKNPLVVSASPLSKDLDGIRKLEDAGAGAVVLFSLFEEQIRYLTEPYEYVMGRSNEGCAESLHYFPRETEFAVTPDQYLRLIRDASERTNIPIIASLNGICDGNWVNYAEDLAGAGAKAIELNVFYIPADIHTTGQEVEKRYINLVSSLKKASPIPVSVKIGPYFSSVGNVARRLVEEGANGLVIFNRFYQPDFDLDEFEVVPNLDLSTSFEIRLPLLWISILHEQLKCSLAATGGVESAREVAKYLLAGADVVMTTSALLRHGEGYLSHMLTTLSEWMEKNRFDSVSAMQGTLSQLKTADPSAFERANYIKVLQNTNASW